MKALIATLATVIGTTASAGETCTVQIANGNTVKLSQEGSLVSISHYGNSRNTYHALYSIEECKWNRVGPKCTLIKVQDLSNWQDMPETLKLKYGSLENIESVTLFGLYDQPIVFSSRLQCPQVAEEKEL